MKERGYYRLDRYTLAMERPLVNLETAEVKWIPVKCKKRKELILKCFNDTCGCSFQTMGGHPRGYKSHPTVSVWLYFFAKNYFKNWDL